MKIFLRGIVCVVLGLAGLSALTTSASAQGTNPPPKTTPPGEWKFDGGQWQFQPGGGVMPPQSTPGSYPQPPPPKTTYPGTAPTYPQTYPSGPQPYVQPYTQPSVKVQIGTQPIVSISPKYVVPSGALVPVGPGWIVRYKKFSNEAWHHYAVYSNKSAAFNVATNLSNQGFWAAVTSKQ